MCDVIGKDYYLPFNQSISYCSCGAKEKDKENGDSIE